MDLPVNPAKVLRLFAPLWALLALSLWVHWEAWFEKPALFGALVFLPLLAAGLAGLARKRWRLELTPDALVHHTPGRTERFDWRRMGPVEIRRASAFELLFVRTFWFAFPLDARSLPERGSRLVGRRLLCVFGDRSPRKTVEQIEEWRALHAQRALRP